MPRLCPHQTSPILLGAYALGAVCTGRTVPKFIARIPLGARETQRVRQHSPGRARRSHWLRPRSYDDVGMSAQVCSRVVVVGGEVIREC
jgi:hypothetical protein